jgi:aryl-alcohol dehydrogenase-like predicted oxidoreductase
MEYRRLGWTELKVSCLCLGTMTFGEQNTEADAHAQLDRAIAAGINFIDTAELYPVPPHADTYGRTEEYIGSWLKARGNHDQVILATKIAGPDEHLSYIRGGQTRFDRKHIEAALNASLKRLQTDTIDLYQLHWPERSTNYFGQLGYVHDANEQCSPIEETLRVLGDQIKAGKIRYVGLSNETPWGVMHALNIAANLKLPRVVSIQNPYSLLNRSFEIGLAEITHRELIGLLAYSPLAFGVLSGKYLNNAHPQGARLSMFERFTRYNNPQARAATQAYVELARHHGLSPAQMALAFVTSRPFLTSNIIGATTLAQLDENIASADVKLSHEVLDTIDDIHRQFTIPCP